MYYPGRFAGVIDGRYKGCPDAMEWLEWPINLQFERIACGSTQFPLPRPAVAAGPRTPQVPPARNPLDYEGRRIVICDYNALLLSVTGLLRMSGFVVFQAYDARAALELCAELPNIELLILNTTGTGTDSATLVREIRVKHPDLPALHIGPTELEGMPANVPTLGETFTADELLAAVRKLLPSRVSVLRPAG